MGPPPGSASPHIGGASPSTVSSPRPGGNPLAAAAAAIAPHDQEKVMINSLIFIAYVSFVLWPGFKKIPVARFPW